MTPPRSAQEGNLAITGLGLVTALARDCVTSCAAARAGMTRATRLVDFPLWNSTTCEAEPAIGHRIDDLTRGFVGTGRFLRLAAAAAEDLSANYTPKLDGRIGIIVNLPSDDLFRQSHISSPSGQQLSSDVLQRVEGELAARRARITNGFARVSGFPGLDAAVSTVDLIFGDECGFIAAVERARELLTSHAVDACIVAGVDSQVDAENLTSLHQLQMLKSPDFPVGRIPGEAGAMIVLERLTNSPRRPVLGILRSYAGFQEREGFDNAAPTGEALGRSLTQVLAEISPMDIPGVVISDLTGEERRAQDWSLAGLHVRRAGQKLPQEEWIPALSFGAIGAVAGPTAVCIACRSFARRYGKGTGAIGWLSSDDGRRAAFYVRNPRGSSDEHGE